jgi:hypothetical protein
MVQATGELAVTTDRYEPHRMTGSDGMTVEPVTEFSGICWRRAGQRRQSGRMGWTCSGGSVSPGRPGSSGTAQASGKRGISVGSCSCPAGTERLRACGPRAHSEAVLRGFYAYHLEAGTSPVLNPFPLDRSQRRASL